MNDGFGTALREYRRMAGISQRELAKRTGLDFSYISKIENERIPPPAADTIVLICSVLGVRPEESLALTGKIPSSIQANVSSSKAAQEFLHEAQILGLTDDDWQKMTHSMQDLKRHRG
ncbi:MAG: helix-turn-helix transcriptional regulator [Anaerolineales bacterium]|jgi:transcriptional regulator with XRE-family HTH domain